MADAKHGLGRWFLIAFGGIVIGMGLIGPKLISHRCRCGRVNGTKIEINGNIKTALGQFEVNIGRFPTTAEGLKALVECPSTIPLKDWQDPYMETMPKDSWGKEFRYVCPSTHSGLFYDLASAGSDGRFDTRDDIANYPLPDPGFLLKAWDWAKEHRKALARLSIFAGMVLSLTLILHVHRKDRPRKPDEIAQNG